MKKLGWKETQRLLKKFRIPQPPQFLTKTPEEAVKFAKKIGYPVVMKIESPDILHKTDAKCVFSGIRNSKDVIRIFQKILENAKRFDPLARIDGVLIQKMVSGRNLREIIIGCKKDLIFGHVLMFGLGGIWVEILRDVSFRLIPIKRKDAIEMIQEIKGYKLLTGTRGMEPVNFKALENLLLKVSKMVWKHQNIRELDMNPVFVNEKGVLVVDTRILV